MFFISLHLWFIFFSFLLWCLSMITICLQSQWQWFDLYNSFLFLFKDQTSTRPHCSLSFLLASLPLDREGVQYICCKMVEYSLYVFYYVPLESPLSSGLHERKQKKELWPISKSVHKTWCQLGLNTNLHNDASS